MTKEEKKALKKAEHDAKVKAAAEKAEAEKNEQGQDLAGKEPGSNAGSDSQGAAEENKSANDSSEYSKPNAEKEKVFKVKCNLFHNSKEFKKDSAMHEDDKDFKELKELGFLI
jgi:hypothetical protein